VNNDYHNFETRRRCIRRPMNDSMFLYENKTNGALNKPADVKA